MNIPDVSLLRKSAEALRRRFASSPAARRREICTGRVEPLEPRIVLTVNMVSGTIPNGTVWHDGDIEYVTADATVPAGATLTVEPGAIIKFTSSSDLFMNGTMIADGTAAKPIIFTSYRDDSVGGDTNGGGASAGSKADWSSIKFGATSTGSVMDHTEVRFGGSGVDAAVIVDHAPLALTNSIVSDSFADGMRILGSSPTLTGDTFANNGYFAGSGALSMDLDSNPAITGVTMSSNVINALMVEGGTLSASRTWDDPDIVYWLKREVIVPAGTTLTVAPGQIVKQGGVNAGLRQISVEGTLDAHGTALQPIIFTSYKDDTAGGDSNNDGSATNPSGNDWYDLAFRPGSTGNVLDHVEVRYGGGSFGQDNTSIYVDHAALTLSNSVVRDSNSTGIRIVGSNPTLTNDTFLNNDSFSVFNTTDGAILIDLNSHPAITGCTFTNNNFNGIVVEPGTMTADLTWDALGVAYYLPGVVNVAAGKTLTIAPGVVVKDVVTSQSRLQISGTLMAVGTLAQPIIFTSVNDDSVGGDTDNISATPRRGDAGGVQFQNGSTGSVLDHIEIRYSANNVTSADTNTTVTVRNSVFHDGTSNYLRAFAGGSIVASNNVIFHYADNFYARGIYANGGQITAINNTIDGCTVGAEVVGGSLTLVNNLITNSHDSGIKVSSGGTLTASFNDVFNPGVQNYLGTPDQTGTNGNLSADPKYFNATNHQLQLRAGSPAVDAGTSIGAPTTDSLGHARFDDPNVVNMGAGAQPFFDLGAFERQETATSDVDLRAASMSGPATGLQGDMVTVSWMVENVGAGTAFGSWYDSIYLSADSVLTPDDLFLGDLQHTGDLGAGGSYMASKQVTLPGVLPGDYHFIVRANARNEVFEALALSNNAHASDATIATDLPALTFGVPVNASLPSGAPLYYKINASAGTDLALALDGANGAANELYLKFGDIPSRQSFDVRGTSFDSPDQTLSVPSAIAGSYYAMIVAAKPGPGSFSLTATQPTFGITDISPTRGSNTGDVTVLIHGAHFDGNSQAQLVDSGGHTIPAEKVYFTDSGTIAATFDLAGAPLGAADVKVINTGNVTTTLTDALDVVAGSPGHFSASLSAPARNRTTNFVAYLEYSNDGDTDLLAPLVRLDAVNNHVVLGLQPDRADAATTLYFLATNDEGPAGILPPGAHVRLPIYATAVIPGTDTIEFDLNLAASQTIPWAELEPSIRPPRLTQAEFAPAYAQVQANIGSTFAQYTHALSDAATLLPHGDAGAPSLRDLFQVLINQAAAAAENSVSGRVFLGDLAHPLSGTDFHLYNATTGLVVNATSFTDGSFLFPSVPAGDYAFSVDGFSVPPQATVSVAGDVNLGNLIATHGGSISGGVVQKQGNVPVRGIPVAATAADGTHFDTTTDNNGQYLFSALPPGTYEISTGNDTLTKSIVENVTVAAGGTKPHVNLIVEAAGSIRGTVSGPGGVIAGATVSAMTADGSGFSAETDATGAYTIPGLAGSTYTLTATAPGLARVIMTGVNLPAAGTLTGENFTLAQGGGVSGHVMAAAGGAAAEGVVVTLTGPSGTFAAQTNSSGDYSLADMAAGSYVVTTSSGLFMTKTANASVVAGNTLSLPLSLDARASVSGMVTALGGGAAVPNVIVSAQDATGGIVAATTTDATGHYTLAGFDAGTVQLLLGDLLSPGVAHTSVIFDAAHTNVSANFPIAVAGSIFGKVFEADGSTPAVSAVVGLVQNGKTLVNMLTDDTGAYSFVVLSPGTYQVEAADGGVTYPAITGLNLSGGATLTNENFTPGNLSFSGVVKDASTTNPIKDAAITISRTTAGIAFTSVTTLTSAADGSFSFAAATPGDYRLVASADGHAFATQTFTVGGAPPSLTVNLGAEGMLHGKVRDAGGGSPIASAQVILTNAALPGFRFNAASDTTGAYDFAGLAPGTYVMSALADGHETIVMSSVTITAADKLLDVSLDPANIQVHGSVTNGGHALGQVFITATDASGAVVAQSISAPDGTYELTTLPPGQFNVVASGEGYFASASTPLTVAEGNNLTNFNFTLTPAGLSDIQIEQGIYIDLDLLDTHGFNSSQLRSTKPIKGYILSGDDREIIFTLSDDPNCETKRQDLTSLLRGLDRQFAELEPAQAALGQLKTFEELQTDVLKRQKSLDDQFALVGQAFAALTAAGSLAQSFVDVLRPGLQLRQLSVSLAVWKSDFGNGDFASATTDLKDATSSVADIRKIITFSTAYLALNAGLDISGYDLSQDDRERLMDSRDVQGELALLPDAFVKQLLDRPLKAVDLLETSVKNALDVTSKYSNYESKLASYYRSVTYIPEKFSAFTSCKVDHDLTCPSMETTSPAPAPSGLAAATAGDFHSYTLTLPNCDMTRRIDDPPPPPAPVPGGCSMCPPGGGSGGSGGSGGGGGGFGSAATAEIDIRRSFDPNDKIGPVGFGPQNYIGPGVMPFKILFENDAASGATAPALKVVVTDTLDADLDLSTFEFTSFGFGAFEFDVPKGVANYQTTLDLRNDGINLQVPVTLALDTATRVVTATFDSLDPLTGLTPDDVDAGFLPVNNANHDGEGFFTYNVQPKTGLATGTVITNQANIVFDQNPAILTPTTSHTLDTDEPTSAITTASATQAKAGITLNFQGQDTGSGLGGVDLFVSDNGAPFAPAALNSAGTSAFFVGQPGHTYGFFTLAHDNAGNAEAGKTTAETTITLAPSEQKVLSKQSPTLTFTDDDGTPVKATWSGAGTATIERFNGTGGQGDLFDIVIAGSDAKSKLTITPTKGDTTLAAVHAATPLSALTMKGVHVLSHVALSGAVPSVTLGNLVAGAGITLGGTVAKGVKVAVGDVNGDSALTSAGPLASLQAVHWADGAITAPSLGKLTVAGAKKPAVVPGDFGADLVLTGVASGEALDTVKIAGTIVGGTWDVTGDAGSISALAIANAWEATFSGDVKQIKTSADASGQITANSIKDFTVGANLTGASVTLTQPFAAATPKLEALHMLKITGMLDASTIRSRGHIGSIAAGAVRDSDVFAGVSAAISELPDSVGNFDAAARIAAFTVKGIKGLANAFVNANVAAKELGTVLLRDVLTTNGSDFGVAADKIAKLTIYQGKTVLKKGTGLDTPLGEAFRSGDFVVRVL